MTKKLLATPKNWLTLDVCADIFKNFRNRIGLGEPIPPFSTRFPGRLESILPSVSQSFAGKYLHHTILDAAAAYFNQIIRGHPFQNGNKRMAVLFTHYFLLTHNIDFALSYNELFHFAAFVAKSGEQGITADETKTWCKKVIADFTNEKK